MMSATDPAAGCQTLSTVAAVKAYISKMHVKHIKWHLTLNNTMSTRPMMHGGAVVPSVTKAKTFTEVGSGSANRSWACTLRLPHTFASGDQQELEAVGYGATEDEASEDVCCTAMAKLLRADASNIALRPRHWNVPLRDLMEGGHGR